MNSHIPTLRCGVNDEFDGDDGRPRPLVPLELNEHDTDITEIDR